MFIAKKIITAKEMKTFRAKNSSVMKNFVEKGGADIVRRKVWQKELWNGLREDSKSREVGERGFTKKDLTEHLGKLLNNKDDHFTDRKVKKIADLYGIKRSKVYNAAAENRVAQNSAYRSQLQAESASKLAEQKIKSEQVRYNQEARKQQDAQIQNHISEIISKGREHARPGSMPESTHSAFGRGNLQGEIENDNKFQGDLLTKFENSDKNIRQFGNSFSTSDGNHPQNIFNNAFGHGTFAQNASHALTPEQTSAADDLKARLAKLQSKDSSGEDQQLKEAA